MMILYHLYERGGGGVKLGFSCETYEKRNNTLNVMYFRPIKRSGKVISMAWRKGMEYIWHTHTHFRMKETWTRRGEGTIFFIGIVRGDSFSFACTPSVPTLKAANQFFPGLCSWTVTKK